ncbi:MobB, partial [Lactiplantibacillus plantarum]|nr:MobB [Lactiplantibacillus plantarum]
LWDGIWRGLGLNKLTDFVLTLAKSHPFGGGVLGLILMILVVTAIIASFWAMVQAVKTLSDWDADKLMFWRHDRY